MAGKSGKFIKSMEHTYEVIRTLVLRGGEGLKEGYTTITDAQLGAYLDKSESSIKHYIRALKAQGRLESRVRNMHFDTHFGRIRYLLVKE